MEINKMITITFNDMLSEYNVFNDSKKIATFKESELQLIASQNGIAWPKVISPDCNEVKHIVELAL